MAANYLALVAVEANIVGDEADLAAGLADDGLVVDLRLGGDLTEDHHHVGLGAGLAGDLDAVQSSAQIFRGMISPVRRMSVTRRLPWM